MSILDTIKKLAKQAQALKAQADAVVLQKVDKIKSATNVTQEASKKFTQAQAKVTEAQTLMAKTKTIIGDSGPQTVPTVKAQALKDKYLKEIKGGEQAVKTLAISKAKAII